MIHHLSPIPQPKQVRMSAPLSPVPTYRKSPKQKTPSQRPSQEPAPAYTQQQEQQEPPRRPKCVRFSTIKVFEMPVILGDNPCASSGCPITIDWTPQRRSCIPLDYFESHRPQRRCKAQLRISAAGRRKILMRAGVTASEMQASMQAAMRVQKQRFTSIRAQRRVPGLCLGLRSARSRHGSAASSKPTMTFIERRRRDANAQLVWKRCTATPVKNTSHAKQMLVLQHRMNRTSISRRTGSPKTHQRLASLHPLYACSR